MAIKNASISLQQKFDLLEKEVIKNHIAIEDLGSSMGLDKLNGSGVVLVGAAMGDDKVNFVCKVSKDVVAKGAKAGNIVKAAAQVAGGNGGGRPDMAQAGGKEPAKLMEALKAGGEALKSMLQ